ncbi:MAG TPA: sugar isomerase domain-containing protein [Firmicutes bacterium]|nr:sugar isomerase domain-containing protein [Bacillota bacterium]
MSVDRYFDAISELVNKIRQSQKQSIGNVAKKLANIVEQRHVIHIYDSGHMLSSELIGRAGGLMLLTPLRFQFTVDNPAVQREKNVTSSQRLLGLASLVLDYSCVKEGDALIIGSVSGRQIFPIELAIEAKRRGIYTVGLTSLSYSSRLSSNHPSGKRLFEAVDDVLDNCAPFGDALLAIDGLSGPMCPASGIGAACVAWALCAALTEELISRGLTPHVYKSINMDGGEEANQRELEEYKKLGY